MRLDRPHEQAITRPLPHDELVQLHCRAAQARVFADPLPGNACVACVIGWLDKEMTWLAPPDGSPGRPAVFSDAAIQFCLTIKVLFKLPLRQTTGMVFSLLKMASLDWAVPDYTTLCRRQRTLAVQIPYRRADGPLNLLVDSTGIKFLGDGALSGDCFAIPCRVTNGRHASMVFRADANRCPLTVCWQTVRGGARCIWPWIRPRRTYAP